MQVFFVESICDDPEIITENIKVRNMYTYCTLVFLKKNKKTKRQKKTHFFKCYFLMTKVIIVF